MHLSYFTQGTTSSSSLDRLTLLHVLQLRIKHPIPESTGNTKPILKVGEVVLQVIPLQTLPVRRQRLMMQEIMRQVVRDVSEDAAREYHDRDVPVPIEDGVRELIKRESEDHKECGRHDEALFVHREVVVDTMEQEVQG